MLCDGRALDVSGYPELFSVLGYLYSGSGDTFHIPDYRGTFLRGNDCGAGKDPDVALRTSPAGGDQIDKGIGSRQAAAMLFHEHTYQAVPLAVTLADVGETASSAPGQAMTSAPTDANGKLLTADISQFETRPCNTSVNYLIKFTCGVGPVWAQMWL
jgi:microcystin-dependent protein